MIQSVALMAAGVLAAGIWLTDSVTMLVACWVLGTVLHGGLVLAFASPTVRGVTREVILAEMFGSWVLLMAGLNLVLATGAVDLAGPLTTEASGRELGWAGLGLLLVVAARLGLPPVGPWPSRLAASPPAVRLFLHAAVYPLTAHLLWWRLDPWLLPWHRHVALGLGGLAALAALLAATGERQLSRRAALLGAAFWSGLLALTVHGEGPSWLALGTTTAGAMAVQLTASAPRWPRRWRRALLASAGVAVLAAAGLAVAKNGWRPAPLSTAGVSLTLIALVLGHWWRTVAVSADANTEPRQAAWPAMAWLARQSRRPGPLSWFFELITRRLSALVASVDKVVLDGVVEGMALMSLGAGWMVAWCDRRGLDAVERALAGVSLAAGRWTRALVAAGPARLVLMLGVLIMTLILLGGGLR